MRGAAWRGSGGVPTRLALCGCVLLRWGLGGGGGVLLGVGIAGCRPDRFAARPADSHFMGRESPSPLGVRNLYPTNTPTPHPRPRPGGTSCYWSLSGCETAPPGPHQTNRQRFTMVHHRRLFSHHRSECGRPNFATGSHPPISSHPPSPLSTPADTLLSPRVPAAKPQSGPCPP